MDERTTGLILRTRPLTETSVIVNWLTPDLGRISTVAKGAIRPKSPFRGKLDLFYLADFTFRRSRRSELHNLIEVSVLNFHPGLRENLSRLEQAAYFAKLIEQTTETESPIHGIFELFQNALTKLLEVPPCPLTGFVFETKLLNELGLKPKFRDSSLTAGAAEILERATTTDWTSLSRIKLSSAQEHEIGKFLASFLTFHLGTIPKGRFSI